MKSSLHVVVNADDLGITSKVNGQVERLHQLGVLSSATIMANGRSVEEIEGIQSRNPDLGLGVHLNASNFKALTEGARRSQLCDVEGVFHSDFRARYSRSMASILLEEWVAQVEAVKALGIQVDHLDSHHHVHTWPSVFRVIQEVARRVDVKWVRNTRNLVPLLEKATLSGKIKYTGKWLWTSVMTRGNVCMTAHFCSVADLQKMISEDEIDRLAGTLELMCHPGDDGNEEYVQEVMWLEKEFLAWLDGRGLLVNYSGLPG